MTNEPYLLVVVVLREGNRVGLEEGIWMGYSPYSWVFSYTYNLHIYYLNMLNSNTNQVTSLLGQFEPDLFICNQIEVD